MLPRCFVKGSVCLTAPLLLVSCVSKQERIEEEAIQLQQQATNESVLFGNVIVNPEQDINLHFSPSPEPTYNDGLLWAQMAGKKISANARTFSSRADKNMKIATLPAGRYYVFLSAGEYASERNTEYTRLPYMLTIPEKGKSYYFGDLHVNLVSKYKTQSLGDLLTNTIAKTLDYENRFDVNAELLDNFDVSAEFFQSSYGSRLATAPEKLFLQPIH